MARPIFDQALSSIRKLVFIYRIWNGEGQRGKVHGTDASSAKYRAEIRIIRIISITDIK